MTSAPAPPDDDPSTGDDPLRQAGRWPADDLVEHSLEDWSDEYGDGYEDEFDDDEDVAQQWPLVGYEPAWSLGDNAWRMSVGLWGVDVADELARFAAGVARCHPDAAGGRRKRGWTGALLLAGARRGLGCRDSAPVPAILVEDVLARTGLTRQNLERYWRRLVGSGVMSAEPRGTRPA